MYFLTCMYRFRMFREVAFHQHRVSCEEGGERALVEGVFVEGRLRWEGLDRDGERAVRGQARISSELACWQR